MLGMRDVSALSLRRPVDRGYVVAWDLQRDILARRAPRRAVRGAGRAWGRHEPSPAQPRCKPQNHWPREADGAKV